VKQQMFSLVVRSVEIRRVCRRRPAAGVSIRRVPHLPRSISNRLVSAISRKRCGSHSGLFASFRIINQPILQPLNPFRSSDNGIRKRLTRNLGMVYFLFTWTQAGCLGNSTAQLLRGVSWGPTR
jgi:hypothetical protein